MNTERSIFLDIARAISMLWIIGVWHLLSVAETNIKFLIPITWTALSVFMFLSGYLLGKRYKINNLDSLLFFVKRRFIRIIPLFSISVITLAFISGKKSILYILFNIIGLSVFTPPMIPTLWFVSMLLLFYMLFPLFSNKGIFVQLGCFIFIFVAFLILKYFDKVDERFFYYFPCFILGVMLCNIDLKRVISRSHWIFLAVIIFLTAIVVLSYYEKADLITINYLFHIIIGISGLFICIYFSYLLSKVKNISKLVYFLAYGSMVAYLFHRQILSVFYSLPAKYGYIPTDGIIKFLYLYLFVLPIILFFGYYIQRFYDIILDRISKIKI